MTPCQKLLKQEGTARRIESMQQSSATPSLHLWFLGVAEDCCMLSILLAVPSCFNSFWHGVTSVSSLHPTSFLMIFTLVIIKTRCNHSHTKARAERFARMCGFAALIHIDYARFHV